MPPPMWNDIRDRAIAFSRAWADARSEVSDDKPFLDAFFEVFGVSRRRVGTFQSRVKKLGDRDGYIDLLWKGVLLVEQKSTGANLDRAYDQARDYFPGLSDAELPQFILVCDFQRFRLYDLEQGGSVEFTLADLPKNVEHFWFIAGYKRRTYREQDPVNLEAAERMGKLHDLLRDSGYVGHDLEVLLVRLLFCLFGEDTGIFSPQGCFQDYIETRTSPDGADLGPRLHALFEVLNTEIPDRLRTLDEALAAFPYVDGRLFAEGLRVPAFDRKMRDQLLDCCGMDWGAISPAIFGALFQSIMDVKARRHLGAHYTTEANILKLIAPLFLDELWVEFERVRRNPPKLRAFHQKLRSLRFLDPACGCGNFLVITYRELRLLELELLRSLPYTGQTFLVESLTELNVDQFHGIEIEEFPAQIAQVALWLMDHQMNMMAGMEFGQPFARIPLRTSSTIVNDNACTLDWATVIDPASVSYVYGNPPFVGAKFLSPRQREDAERVFEGVPNAGLLDYVTCWYLKAARYIQGTNIRCAFVSTNSIAQGEQVGVLWDELLRLGVQIQFAHRTFAWTSEAKGKAAVHCVIIGFGLRDITPRRLYDYEDLKGQPHEIAVQSINPYLVDGPMLTVKRRSEPLCPVPSVGIGNKPIDQGHYLFDAEAHQEFLRREPVAATWFRRWVGAEEFLHDIERWCLWLGDCTPGELKSMPEALQRVDAVRKFRLESKSAPTRALASRPTRFHVENMPTAPYLVIPGVSSERRRYIPIGFLTPDVLCSNLVYLMPNATLFHFGVLSSLMHVAWVGSIGGRLKSDFRFSKDVTYNNFPWPMEAPPLQRAAIEKAAQGVLDARAAYPGASLALLYDRLTMPSSLVKSHDSLDRAVERAYGATNLKTEAQRVAFLLVQYQKLTTLYQAPGKARRRRS